MLIDALAAAIEESGALAEVYAKLDAGEDAALAIAASARPFAVAARFASRPQPMLVVIPGEDAVEGFARSVAAYIGDENVAAFPARVDYPFAPKTPDARFVARRARAAWGLQSGAERVTVASAASIVRALAPHGACVFAPLIVRVESPVIDGATGEALDMESVAVALVARGFQNTGDALEGPGTFCVRGGTMDIFPGDTPYPVRIDFFGDDVDEIRRVVPSTGQTIMSLSEVDVYPVREYRLGKKAVARALPVVAKRAESDPVWRDLLGNLQGGTDFVGADALLPLLCAKTETLCSYVSDAALVVLSEPRSIFDDASRAYDDAQERSHGSHITVDGLYIPPSQLDFGHAQRYTLSSIMRVGGMVDAQLPVKRSEVAGSAEKLVGRLRSLVDQRYTTVFSVPDVRARRDMKLLLVDNALPVVEILDAEAEGISEGGASSAGALSGAQAQGGGSIAPAFSRRNARSGSDNPSWHRDVRKLKRGVVNVVDVDIPLGMIIPSAKVGLVSVHDTQGRTSQIRGRRRVDMTEVTFPFAPGDYVVHAAHGVALFKDLVRQDMGGTMRDYLLLEYAEGDKLFVPVEQLDRVTRYVGPEGSSPRCTRLNTSDWSRALSKARKATKQLAFDLVDVYTRRASVQGFRYAPDTPWQREMEEAFPYEETPDQLAAIAEVKADMQSSKPMDRLVCGDVGFGKTEVALRAAFKATQDNKQVMVLCPTTILAQQHYTTFKERFEPFGVKVEVLSRFRSPAEQKLALKGFSEGTVNVLVGTHRLLSRDVNPRDLGLVVIDEEQRFGVAHKEQMKNLREQIDVLTLSATPIPRTMQMSLSGVRDMSLILTPPDNRRPVEVHVGEWDVDVVSEAIRRELQRGGQVYYVSNRVRTIDEAVARVGAAAAEARVGVAHGKMSKEELERVMEDFSAGAIDVLVATTIIESGIDNPHTNTLIIEDSQRLGLAQMYQLKGRVGRSAQQAYAYFMFPESVSLTEEAMARLDAINEHRDLGSGMRVAMRDLEIRGAGSLLGAEQSGNMSGVGFDLFAQMLSQAVSDAREGKPDAGDTLPPALSDITVNVPVHTYIPEEYVPDADERVLLYRKLACAELPETVDELLERTQERYGAMPQACANMFAKSRLRAWASEHGVKLISVSAGKVAIEPIDVPRSALTPLRRYGARYVAQTGKLSVPVKYFDLGEDDSLIEAIEGLARDLANGESADGKANR
ncbi:MAG: transcription-repair coupling factor [Slackia sp.]|nr:transcription-repair coupling factor [Slackia sp.]